MAKCIEDGDKKIADMGRMFFAELATKDNAIYNQFVDMFSVLSADEALDEEAFRRILRFLAGFIEKVRHDKLLPLELSRTLTLMIGQTFEAAGGEAGGKAAEMQHGEAVE